MSHPTTTKHDVFLSFRGEDTRDNLTSHLYAELCRKNIETFIDYRLGRGEEISPALDKAIEESTIYVVILSEKYASSTWCLDELKKILECKERYGREVIPVFYKVDPSTVRHQKESYAKAFVKHQQRYSGRVDEWKAALNQVAGLSGWDSQVTRPEHTLVTEIVKDILQKLNHRVLSDYEGMIGIEKHIEKIQSLLHLESSTVQIIGIWGMGGIGKTTIANAIYHKLSTQFTSKSIILNAQQEIQRAGLGHVQRKYLSQLLEEDITSSGFNFSYIPRLQRAKVLLVLDDVNDSDQLEGLIGRGNFGLGSRIIVISRDKQVLENVNANEIYEVRQMDFQDSLRLFCLSAFKQNYPIETYVSLSEKVINYAKGVPLALKVLGLLLRERTKEAWVSELQKLEKIPDLKTFKVLSLSYDGLDDEQKNIFLDIACFYRGHLENVVSQTLDRCGFSARIGMDVLKDRCLISVSEDRIVMHDLIQEMGHEIVRQQCVNDPGKRSRLWKPDDIYDVLRKNKGKGTDAIECIFLDICKIKKVQLHAETFKKMHNLRMIQFYNPSIHFRKNSNVMLHEFLKSLPDDLKFLRWDGFPQRSLPQDFCPEYLVTLALPHSPLEQLWEGDKALPNLKRLNLSYCWRLMELPDLSLSPNIEEIILSNCVRLVQVYSSSFLSNLNCLCLNGCVTLRSLCLPSNILSTSSGIVVLHGCRNLETFLISCRTDVVQSYSCSHFNGFWDWENFKDEDKVVMLPSVSNFGVAQNSGGYEIGEYSSHSFEFNPIVDADRYEKGEPLDNICLLNMKVMINTMPSLYTSINQLCWLDISNCESLTCLPAELFNLNSLRRLYLGGCLNLEELPEIEETRENLTVLILDKTAIKELPSSLHHLVRLEELSLQMCTRLETIPSSIGSLSKLSKLDLTYCESLQTFPSSIFNLKLTKLDLHGCSMLSTFPEILEPAESFAHVNLTKTAIKDLPSSLEFLVGLQTLRLRLCSNLVSLPNGIVNLNRLSLLDCSGCCRLTGIPNNIGHLSSLTELSLQESSIVNLPESMAHLSSLKSLDLSDCKRLECIPKLPPNLNQVSAFDCPSIKRVLPNSTLKLLSGSKECTFKFYFTNSQQPDAYFWGGIGDEAWIRINDEYKSVFFCFPGTVVPGWFPYCCQGHSVIMNKDSLYWCGKKSLVGFALCVVLGCEYVDYTRTRDSNFTDRLAFEPEGLEEMDCTRTRGSKFTYRLSFEAEGQRHFLPNHELKNYFHWKGRDRFSVQDHTFLWKYQLDFERISSKLFHAQHFSFEIQQDYHHRSGFQNHYLSGFQSTVVKECGICPLYTK